MNADQVIRELIFKAARSGGAGGQHVNKVATKAILIFDLEQSEAFTAEEKSILLSRLGTRLNKQGRIMVQADDTRSQLKNRKIAESRLLEILEKGLQKTKPRKKTKPTKASHEKRLASKKILSVKKQSRRKPETD